MSQKNAGNTPNESLPFSRSDIQKVLGSAEGQQLLKLLNQDGGQALRQAANALKAGNLAQAQELLSPIMQSEEATRLVDKINKK